MTKRKASVALETENESNQSTSTQDNNSNSTSATNTTSGKANNNNGKSGSSAAGSGASGRQSNGNQSNCKKERADNWSSAEIQVLHRGIDSRRDIFYGPPSQATKKNRELAWEAITKEINSVSTTPRSLSQVMKKFKNEKCRAKRKFIGAEKDGHNNISSTNSNNNDVNVTNGAANNSNNNTNNLSAQTHTNNNNQQLQQQQQQQPTHHLTSTESISSHPSSINVVKLAPQNLAKTMIDLPGHVQQIQMPNDNDMVLIMPSEMDGLLSGMNIVSDGNAHNHMQKCPDGSTLTNQQHNHHGQHTIQAINTGQGLVNGTMGNGMMTRTIPGGMCSLVYSTGSEVCGPEQHLTNNVGAPNQLTASHISVNAQNLMHHRGAVEQQTQGQQQQQQQQHHHQLHQHQHQQAHQQQQPQHQHPQHPHQSQQQITQQSHHLQHNHLATTATITANPGGVSVESQLKNLLSNLLQKDGQHSSVPITNSNQDYNKQRNDMLAIIASSLTKIETHLSKIAKVASSHVLFTSSNLSNNSNDNGSIPTPTSVIASASTLNMNNNGTDNNLDITGSGNTNTMNNQSGNQQ